MGELFIKELNKKFLVCNKCKHKWAKRYDELPLLCPKCKTPRWNLEPKKKKKLDHKHIDYKGGDRK